MMTRFLGVWLHRRCWYSWYFKKKLFIQFYLNKTVIKEHTVQSRESEINRATAALSWSSLLATPHILLTSHDRRDEHSWTKTALNKTVQSTRKPHAVNMLQGKGSIWEWREACLRLSGRSRSWCWWAGPRTGRATPSFSPWHFGHQGTVLV